MTDPKHYTGVYCWMDVILNVQEVNDQLTIAIPSVPKGYEALLERDKTDHFRMHGGPLDGAMVVFVRNESNEITTMQADGLEFTRVPPESVNNIPTTERLLAPNLDLTLKKEAAFAELLQTLMNIADGNWIDYHLPYPKHEFIQYVSAQDTIIFHGSNNTDIDIFTPIRKSIELGDKTGQGNLQATYGTQDGLWAMFFAVVDRDRLRGSIRNGVIHFHNQHGKVLAVYNFSINQEQLPEKPWCNGALYFLPRDTFVRLKLGTETYANEWASKKAIRPIAKLHVQPEDFPFLEKVSGHDDGPLLRLSTLSKAIRGAARQATLEHSRFTITIPATMRDQLEEYITLQQWSVPSAQFTITPKNDEITLEITTPPPAFRQVLEDKYAHVLTK